MTIRYGARASELYSKYTYYHSYYSPREEKKDDLPANGPVIEALPVGAPPEPQSPSSPPPL